MSEVAQEPIVESLLWLCRIASPTGEEQALCAAVEARLRGAALAGPVVRVGDSLVV